MENQPLSPGYTHDFLNKYIL
ncbi:hypothetical protein OOU_Y34scaffold00346g7 [Pyricularia oryzae Y34]|uniref:Uncharacterized protein n=1 Tax=Pyricularia oryzae (strain Y34) TaxID=1143189 RepID=A0AA97P2J8_PYRO3|nr:hypothetical protein OOU_Y34scaffold00346g7 [Pyricularia oryzae Y34]